MVEHNTSPAMSDHGDTISGHISSRRSSRSRSRTGRNRAESIYRPNFYRQRSVSFNNYLFHQSLGDDVESVHAGTPDSDNFHIHVIRRKSLGYNMKLDNSPQFVGPPTAVIQSDSENRKNELIISIPVLLEDENAMIDKEIIINKERKDITIMDNCECEPPPYDEPVMQSSWNVLKQMLIPFLIAGIGSVGAGIVLNDVQNSDSFKAIPQLLIMVPSFLGLIGNIETTLASRLSTHANLGTLDDFSRMKSMICANSAVVLCQAATVGLFAAFASLAMYYITGAQDTMGHEINIGTVILLLCASSVATSCVANTLLATAITSVIVIARKININPDNIATPIAASMGDVCTITILGMIADTFYDHCRGGREWIAYVTLIVLMLMAPVMGFVARRNRYTRSVILTGWTPILGAVIIEQPGGVVMDKAFRQYDTMSTFQPLVNGIGSNLVGIQTSRLSTYLHQTSPKGQLPKSDPTYCVHPLFPFLGSNVHARMARLLLGITAPAHLFYLVIIYFWKNNFTFTVPFVGAYMVAVIAQIAILLFLAYTSVLWAWKRHINPDNSAIPFTSALADVLGNCLMAGAFTILNLVNDPNAIPSTDSPLVNATTLLPNTTTYFSSTSSSYLTDMTTFATTLN